MILVPVAVAAGIFFGAGGWLLFSGAADGVCFPEPAGDVVFFLHVADQLFSFYGGEVGEVGGLL